MNEAKATTIPQSTHQSPTKSLPFVTSKCFPHLSSEFVSANLSRCSATFRRNSEQVASTGASFSRSNLAQVKGLEAKFEGWGCRFEPKVKLFWRNELRVSDNGVFVHPFCSPFVPTQVPELDWTSAFPPVKVAVKLKVKVNPACKPLLRPANHDVADKAKPQMIFRSGHLQLVVTSVSENVVADDVLPTIVLMEATVRRVVDNVVLGDDAR